jgi:hypothetical protein
MLWNDHHESHPPPRTIRNDAAGSGCFTRRPPSADRASRSRNARARWAPPRTSHLSRALLAPWPIISEIIRPCPRLPMQLALRGNIEYVAFHPLLYECHPPAPEKDPASKFGVVRVRPAPGRLPFYSAGPSARCVALQRTSAKAEGWAGDVEGERSEPATTSPPPLRIPVRTHKALSKSQSSLMRRRSGKNCRSLNHVL